MIVFNGMIFHPLEWWSHWIYLAVEITAIYLMAKNRRKWQWWKQFLITFVVLFIALNFYIPIFEYLCALFYYGTLANLGLLKKP